MGRSSIRQQNKLISPSVNKIDFDFKNFVSPRSSITKDRLLLVGNASLKRQMGSKVDAFSGDIGRFNRFQEGYESYLGTRTTHWVFSNNLLFDGRQYVYRNLDRIRECHPGIKPVLVTTINRAEELVEKEDKIKSGKNIEVMNTIAITKILASLTNQYIQQNGKLIIPDHPFLQKNRYIKPATGLLAIIYGVLNYKEVFIHNFDFFRSDHYWSEKPGYGEDDSDGKWFKGIDVDKAIGHHEYLFEEIVINQMVREGLVKWFK